ncbi:MAG: hypothetical protein ACK5JH_07950 [Anaerocolumna sp.]
MALKKYGIIDLKEINVKNEQELTALVKQINAEIEFANITRAATEKEKTLNLDYLLKRYRTIKGREDTKNFREEHDCEYCLYYERPRKCFEKTRCPLDSGIDFEEKEIDQKIKCPKDKEGNCPYGNEVDTCFGFCMQKIVNEFKEERRSGKQ